MRTTTVTIFILLAGLFPVAGQGINEQVPIDPITIKGNYQVIASCVYRRLDDDMAPAIKKIDLTNETLLIVDNSAYKLWQLKLTPAQPGYTLVNFSRAQTAIGPMRVPTQKVMEAVKACAG